MVEIKTFGIRSTGVQVCQGRFKGGVPEASKVVLKTVSSALAHVVSLQLSHSCAKPPSERLLPGHARHAA